MVTISHLVKAYVAGKPVLLEALQRKIINYGALAEEITPYIKKELGKSVKHSAIVMALRRYADEISKNKLKKKKFNYHSEIIVKTNLCDISVAKSRELHNMLNKIQDIVNIEDVLNIIHGNYEVSVIISDKHKESILKLLATEEILNVEEDLVSIALKFNKDFFETPGVIYELTRMFAWENINIVEVVSTLTEMNFILHKKDSTKAYQVLTEFIDK